MRLRFALISILFLAFAVRAADAPPLVAVMPLVGVGVDSASSQVATDALSDELLKTGRVRVMERSQMAQILKEQGFQKSGACDGAECAVQVGKLLSVRRIVVGTLGKIGASYSLSVRVIDAESGEVVGSARRSQRGEIDQAVLGILPEIALEISGYFSAAKVPLALASAPTPVSREGDAQAIRNYAQLRDLVKGRAFLDSANLPRMRSLAESLHPQERKMLYEEGSVSGWWALANFLGIPVGSLCQKDWLGSAMVGGSLVAFGAVNASDSGSTAAKGLAFLWFGLAIGRPIYYASHINGALKGVLDDPFVPTPSVQLDGRGWNARLAWGF